MKVASLLFLSLVFLPFSQATPSSQAYKEHCKVVKSIIDTALTQGFSTKLSRTVLDYYIDEPEEEFKNNYMLLGELLKKLSHLKKLNLLNNSKKITSWKDFLNMPLLGVYGIILGLGIASLVIAIINGYAVHQEEKSEKPGANSIHGAFALGVIALLGYDLSSQIKDLQRKLKDPTYQNFIKLLKDVSTLNDEIEEE